MKELIILQVLIFIAQASELDSVLPSKADQILLLLPQICAWMASPPAWDSADSAAPARRGGPPSRGAPPTRSERRQFMAQKFSANRQVYENCRMLSKQGELLCFCDARKVAWYEASRSL